MIRIVCALAMVVFLNACGTLSAPEPNPDLINKIDSYFAQAKNKTYKASGSFTKPIPYNVGQYVTTGMTSPTEKVW